MGLGIVAAIAGSSILGALGAKSAANAQEKASEAAGQLERERMAEDTRRYEEMKPYRTAGLESVTSLSDIMAGRTDPTDALQADPGYKFRLSQGQTALDRFLSARGYRLGGRALKEGVHYNQNVASQEYGNYINNKFRLAGLSGQPTPAPSATGAANAIMAGGQAQAGAYEGYNQAIQGGMQNYTTYRTYNDWMNKLPNPNAGYTPIPGTGGGSGGYSWAPD